MTHSVVYTNIYCRYKLSSLCPLTNTYTYTHILPWFSRAYLTFAPGE